MSEPELPIDIHFRKLIDWMVDRGKMDSKWQAALRQISNEVENAIVDLPDIERIQEILKVKGNDILYIFIIYLICMFGLGDEGLNYFDCIEIMAQLEASCAKDGMSFFGKVSFNKLISKPNS
jgi:hypothetical protein